jgi:signal transduction histidine kinase
LVFSFIGATSQSKQIIDSLRKQLAAAPANGQFELLNALGWEYRLSFPDSTIKYSQQAYNLGQRLKLKKNLAISLNYLGVAFNYKGDRLKAFEYYQQAIQVAENQHDSIQLAYGNNNMGRLLFEQGLLPKSFTYFVAALKLFNENADLSGTAYVKQSLANLYRLEKDYEKSKSSYFEALSIRLRLKKSRDIMAAYVQLGTLFQETNKLDSSNFYLLKADSIGQHSADDINLAEVKVLLAENYLRDNKIKEATSIGEAGFSIITKMNNIRMLPRALIIMGKIQLAKNEFGKARQKFIEALKVSKETKVAATQMNANFMLAEVAKKMGNRQDEMRHLNDYLILKDSLEDLELARQVERLQFELQIASKERELELLQLKQTSTESIVSQQRLENVLLSVIVLFLLAIAIIIWQVSKRRRKINETLARQNEQITLHQQEINNQNETLSKRNQLLSDFNHEKNTLMSIVAHDLKSPLNRIMGLVALIKMEGPLTKEQEMYAGMIKDATKAGASLITDLLDVNEIENEDHATQLVSLDLIQLLKDRINYFQVIALSKNIKLEDQLAVAATIISEASYLDRILDNLISNAIKFSRSGTTILVTARLNKDKVFISIKDQGPGFTENDKRLVYQKFKRLSARPTASESSNGLGLAIVKTLVDRLGGEIQLETEVGKGSEFIITLPLGTSDVGEALSSKKTASKI